MFVGWRYGVQILTLLVVLVCSAPPTSAQENREFELVGNHVKTQYRARRKPTPFMGVANLAVKIVRPAGVKSFKLAAYEDLHDSTSVGHAELDAGIRRSLGEEWQPLVRIHSRAGEQTIVYAREAQKDVNLMIVIVDESEATVLRVKVTPQALARWMENPKMLGRSLASDVSPSEQ